MAVTTIGSRVSIAKYLKSKIGSTYIGIGGKDPWPEEGYPPKPSETAEDLITPIGYKKVDKVSLCRKITDPEQAKYHVEKYQGEYWEMIPDEEAYREEATYVYFEAYIKSEDFTLGEYRQVGIFTGLKPKEGVFSDTLEPHEVEDVGLLEIVENRERHNRTRVTNILERFIVNVTERR